LILARPEAAPPPPPPQDPPAQAVAATPLFETADRCMACHNGVTSSSGEDVSIGFSWRASMMANAARDPYWHAAVRREITDHPQARALIEDTCSTCHMPMSRYEAHFGGGSGEVFENLPVTGAQTRSQVLAADGVSCSACHQITAEGLGDSATFTGGFHVDETTPWGERALLGPFETDRGRAALMNSATGFVPRQADHIQSSELCASCHTLYTESLDAAGNQVGELPEQVPYLEWLASDFAAAEGGRSCQSCHMPVVSEPVAVTGVLGQPREDVNRHIFLGGNFFMLGMLNRYRGELGVKAMPQELDAAVLRTVHHLQTETARVELSSDLSGGTLSAAVTVTNLGGHKLPTAYPSRRAWLHLTVRDAGGAVVFESGALERSGAIEGNDNDRDGSLYEPHYDMITGSDQVQIYEPILVDVEGNVTTGLLSGYRYAKDNRLLPRGFVKENADPDVAVYGEALDDADFQGGADGIRYEVAVAGRTGPFTVDVELRFQPIGFRWARNLDGYNSFETDRFLRYYDEMSSGSDVTLATASTTVE
jgi:hypothetical protein